MEEGNQTRIVHYTASSAYNTDTFVNNRPGSFTNKVPRDLFFDCEDKLYVRIKSISIAPWRKKTDITQGESFLNYIGYIQIYMDEIETNPLVQYNQKLLGTVKTRDLQIRGHVLFHEFKRSFFLKSDKVPLTQLSINIVTSQGRPWPRIPGAAPTNINLEIAKMNGPETITMTCMSHGAREKAAFPDNTLSEFSVQMNDTSVDFKDHKVAVTGVAFPSDTYFTPNVWLKLVTQRKDGSDLEQHEDKFNFDLTDYTETEEWTDDVRAKIADSEQVGRLVEGEYYHVPDSDAPASVISAGKIKADGIKGAITPQYYWTTFLIRRKVDDADTRVIVTMSKGFGLAMGFATQRSLHRVVLKDTANLYFKDPSIERALPPTMALLECSIVTPSVVGGERKQILRPIPLSFNSNNHYFEPKILLFHNVVRQPFEEIKFRLLKPDGRIYTLTTDDRRNADRKDGGLVIHLAFVPNTGFNTSTESCGAFGIGDC